MGVAFRTAGSVSRERDNGTLIGLLTLPVGRLEILRAKWLGGVLRLREVGYCLGGIWLVCLLGGAFHPLALLLLLVACAIHLAFLASVGVCLSVVCRNTLWAHSSMALVVLVVIAGSWTLLGSLEAIGPSWQQNNLWGACFLEVGLNPLAAWWSLGFSKDSGEILGDRVSLTATLAGLLLYAELAWLFWQFACLRFRRRQPRNGRANSLVPCGTPPA